MVGRLLQYIQPFSATLGTLVNQHQQGTIPFEIRTTQTASHTLVELRQLLLPQVAAVRKLQILFESVLIRGDETTQDILDCAGYIWEWRLSSRL
jgi:hypothetical protein